MKTTVLVIDKDQTHAEYLKNILNDEGYEVVIFNKALQALKDLEEKNVDIIISSYYSEDLLGDAFYKEVHREYPNLPIIFMSHQAHRDIISAILSLPNADYMVKPLVPQELLARIENALEENTKVAESSVLSACDLTIDIASFEVRRNGKLIEMTPTEFSLLRYLLINKGKVLTRGMILNRVWGYSADVSSRVVDVYIGYLRDKIDSNSKKPILETVRGFGYRIKDEN